MDANLLKQLQKKVEEELRQREVAIVEFWLNEFKVLEAKRHRDLARRMETRLKVLKEGKG